MVSAQKSRLSGSRECVIVQSVFRFHDFSSSLLPPFCFLPDIAQDYPDSIRLRGRLTSLASEQNQRQVFAVVALLASREWNVHIF